MRAADPRPPAGREDSSAAAGSPAGGKPSRLWLCFVAAFVLQLGVWTAWFVIASKNKVAEVPLVQAGGTPWESNRR